jgi:probable rRNA maturation factor
LREESRAEVEVQVAQAFAGLLPAELLRAVVEAVLHAEGQSGQVTLVVTDDEGIRELNRDFLNRDITTDVLAFSAQEDGGAFVAAPETGDYLGDVIVSYPRAVAQADEYGHSPERELCLLAVHGTLHLLGYDHVGDEEKATMWAKQEAILSRL